MLDGFFVIIDADTFGLQSSAGHASKNELHLGRHRRRWRVGVIGILLTGALARGSRVVRILFTIWIAFQIAGGLQRT